MKLISLDNWDSSITDETSYDFFVSALSNDERSKHFASAFEGRCSRKVVVAGLNSQSDTIGEFERLGFSIVELSAFEQYLKKIEHIDDAGVSILIDISCMARDVMSSVLATVLSIFSQTSIKLRVKYTIASYSVPPVDISANEGIEAVHSDFSGWSYADSKPTSLVLGLGYEPFKAEGASEYFEPYDQWVFVPESPVIEYLPKVVQNNQELISRSDAENKTIYYKVDDPEMTFGQLEQVVSLLSQSTNPVLMPFGPKILFFLCLIQSLCHPEVGVWHITGNHPEEVGNGAASEYSCGFECVFSSG